MGKTVLTKIRTTHCHEKNYDGDCVHLAFFAELRNSGLLFSLKKLRELQYEHLKTCSKMSAKTAIPRVG